MMLVYSNTRIRHVEDKAEQSSTLSIIPSTHAPHNIFYEKWHVLEISPNPHPEKVLKDDIFIQFMHPETRMFVCILEYIYLLNMTPPQKKMPRLGVF